MKNIRQSDKTERAMPKSLPAGLAVVMILLAAVLVYLPAFNGEWIWDDDTSVYENPVVTAPDGLYKIWFTTEDYDFWPMTKTVFWIEYQIFGNSPSGYHIVNIAFHAIASALIYLVLRRLKVPAALLAGLVFALHPVNASSVAWVAETKNTLSMIFLALTLLAYLHFERCRRRRWYALALAAFALALASKTSVIMLPVGLLGLAWWQRGSISRRDVLQSAAFFCLSAGMAAMTLFAQSRHIDALTRPLDGIYRLAGAGWIVWFYVYKTVAPVNLSMIYPHWKDTIESLGWISFIPTAALAALLVAVVLKRKARWSRPVLFAFGYLILATIPVLGFFTMTIMMHSLVADHFQYVPIVGVIALLCAAGWKFAERRKPEVRFFLGVLAAGMLVSLATLTWKRAEVIKAKEPLWRNTVSRNPQAWMAQYKLGGIIIVANRELLNEAGALHREAHSLQNQADMFAAKGNQRQAQIHSRAARTKISQANAKFQQARTLLLQAEPHCRKAAELQPLHAKSFTNLGLVLVNLGRIDEGIEQYRRGIKADEHFEPEQRSAPLLYNLGLALLKKNRPLEAAAAFKQAYHMQPEFTRAFVQALLVLRGLKKNDEVIELLTRQIEINPKDAGAYHDLAVILFETGRVDEAMANLKRSLNLDPDNPLAYKTQGDIFMATSRPGEAVESFRKSGMLNQRRRILNDLEIRTKLGVAQVRAGQNAEGLAILMTVVRTNPNHEQAKAAIRELMRRLGHTPEAAGCYERALEIAPGWTEGLQNLAWIRATHHDDAVRNTRQAIACAKQLKARVGNRNPVTMDTFAAALAQAGRFPEALDAAKTALKLAKDNRNEKLAGQIAGRIKLYEKGRPYREPR